MRILCFALLGALTLTACGGKVFVDGMGGSGGTGGSGGMTTSSTTTSTDTTSVTTTSTAVTTTTTTTSSTSTGPTCPSNPEVEGSCDVEGLMCPMVLSCCGGHVVCTNGLWKYSPQFCGSLCSPECGPDHFACTGGAVCVTYIGPITTYDCQKDPCPNGLDCTCAEALCEEQGMKCNNIQMGFKVLCD